MPGHVMDFATSSNDVVDEEDSEYCCAIARSGDVQTHFCWPCNTIFCDRCWFRQMAHRKRAQTGGIPHEQTDPFVAKKIQNALEVDLTDKEQAMLHIQDDDTSWFGACEDEQDDLVFQDYGRYANLMAENSERQRQMRYPALVSFVGQTGAGKSTLIRLLIELYASENKDVQVPVVGSTTHQDTPTSGDVHLYCDPKTSSGRYPVLYADCEGLDGGEREPMGAKSRTKRRREASMERQRQHANPRNAYIPISYNASEWAISWATTEKRRSRDYIVRNLYPRLLYTFSDVVVFTMKNPRVIERVIEQLIQWAAVALETSSNQPVLPHAIIVLNATENATDAELWDVDNSTIALMQSVHRALHQNHTLREFAEFWRKRNRPIETITSLMLSYYSNVRVVRVPERGRPKLIFNQLQRLYKEIATACEQARASKHKVRMLLNSDDLQPYLQYAFDHFCRDLDYPFDFVQASFSHNPIPSDFGGNILKLAINIMEVWKDKLDGPKIFKELSYIVASCIMLDSARHHKLGPAEKVLPEYIDHCDDALDDFCDRHWPCEYMSNRGRCVNVKAGHNTKGHQLKNGQVLAFGNYLSSFSPEQFRTLFRDDIYTALAKLLELLQEFTHDSSHLELEQAANIHRDSVLRNFFNHLGAPKEFISHTACFSCLISTPEHPLPCGHVLCTPCVKAFGTSSGRTLIDMKYCPLHENDKNSYFGFSWPIAVKPHGAGLRILTLDGGGIRAIIGLTFLQQIEREFGVELPIQAFFDLIVGTGTGGLVALGLGTKGWSVQQCIRNFEDLCDRAFTKRRSLGLPAIDFLLSPSNHSRYGSKPLESALQAMYGNEELFGGFRPLPDSVPANSRSTKVAVAAMTTNGTVALLANYNRTSANNETSYQFYRSEKPHNEIKAWEAARATSSTPRIFKPFGHEASGQIFQDGGIYYNNPIELAMEEKGLIWPDSAEAHTDIVLSVGTAYNFQSSHQVTSSSARISRWPKMSRAKRLAKLSTDQLQSTLDSEWAWRNFIRSNALSDGVEGRYVRLNLPLPDDPPKLDEVSKMAELQEKTRSRCMRRRDEMKLIAHRLIASSFYFELKPDRVVERGDHSTALTGKILCRFPPGSKEIQALGRVFRKHSTDAYNQQFAEHDPYFVIVESRKEDEPLKTVIGRPIVETMMRQAQFSVKQVRFRISNPIAETNILLCLADSSFKPTLHPISGFPRCLLEEERKVRLKSWQPSGLSRTRTPTARHRDPWRLPDHVDHTFDPIQRYRDPQYLFPGDATPVTLSKISRRFSPVSGPPSYDGSMAGLQSSAYQSFETEMQRAYAAVSGVQLGNEDHGRCDSPSLPLPGFVELDGREIPRTRFELE